MRIDEPDKIIQAIRKADLTLRPSVLFVNPLDAKAIKDAIPKIEEKIVLKESEFIEQGKAYLMNRSQLDEFGMVQWI